MISDELKQVPLMQQTEPTDDSYVLRLEESETSNAMDVVDGTKNYAGGNRC